MEKIIFDSSSSASDKEQALHSALVKDIQEPSTAGEMWRDPKEDHAYYVRIRNAGSDEVDKLFGPQLVDLSALANEVYDAICDTNTKKKFRKFTNLLIEKVEKK